MEGFQLRSSLAKQVAVLATAMLMMWTARGEDWPHWRGPARNGVSAEKGWLERFPDQGPPIAWKASVGQGLSSVVVAEGRAYTAGHQDGQDTVFCFDAATGKTGWRHSYPADLGDKYFDGGTTGTPTFHEKRVYWLSRWGDLLALDAASGKVLWQRQLVKEENVRTPTWGFSGAPTVYKNLLILNVGEAGMAVDKNNGKVIWKSEDGEAGFSTPLPVSRGGKMEVWFSTKDAYVSVDPDSGKENWRIRWVTQYDVNAADPIAFEDKAFISTGYGKGAALYKPPVSGGEEPETIWKNRALRTQMNAGVLLSGFVYGVDGDTTSKAALKCIEIETGKERWSEAEFGSGGIIVADGKIIALAERGELMIAPASPEEFKPVARAQVLGGKSWTAPVLANGLVYCRNTRGDIVVVDLRKNK